MKLPWASSSNSIRAVFQSVYRFACVPPSCAWSRVCCPGARPSTAWWYRLRQPVYRLGNRSNSGYTCSRPSLTAQRNRNSVGLAAKWSVQSPDSRALYIPAHSRRHVSVKILGRTFLPGPHRPSASCSFAGHGRGRADNSGAPPRRLFAGRAPAAGREIVGRGRAWVPRSSREKRGWDKKARG